MKNWLSGLFRPRPIPEPPAPGVYHYQGTGPDNTPFRLHLRIEADGQGILVANASTVIHLNPTAAQHAALYLQGLSEDAAAAWMASRYRVGRGRARRDTQQLRDQIDSLAGRRDQDPVVALGMERAEPFTGTLSAPYRLDLALTYRTDAHGRMDPQARRRVDRELSTDEWKAVMRTAWTAGIPHVTFTGGEPTLRPDLVDLVVEAETLGQVAGLLTDGRRLGDAGFMHALSMAGLDHILLVLALDDEASRAGLKEAIASPVFTAAHLTVSSADTSSLLSTLDELKAWGLTAVSLSSLSKADSLLEALRQARDHAAELGLELVWDLPVPFSANHPVHLEAPESSPGAGRAWLYVEPDGDVLPSQGVDQVLGNILRDPWADIWRRVTAT
jgi:hypothetical protein